MAWIKKGEYQGYVHNLDPRLKKLGADRILVEDGDDILVGRITFPSGLVCDTFPGNHRQLLHLWGEMDVPFGSFKDAALTAFHVAEQCGYAVYADKNRQTIEVCGRDSGQHHLIHFKNDVLVNVTPVKEA